MNVAHDGYACSLDLEGAKGRLPQIRALTERLRARERRDDQLVLRFGAGEDTAELVDAFVRDEQQCCPFFSFHVERRDDEVVLTLSAPAQAGHMLDAAMDSFAPSRGDEDRLAGFAEQAGPGG